jgi:hypothetical protein
MSSTGSINYPDTIKWRNKKSQQAKEIKAMRGKQKELTL